MALVHVTKSTPRAFGLLRLLISNSTFVRVYSPILMGRSTSAGRVFTVEVIGGALRRFSRYFSILPLGLPLS